MIKVLIVEDDPMVSSINEQYLKKIIPAANLHISCCSDAQKALKICKQDLPDLLLLDVYLPQISGTKLLQLLTEQKLHPAVIMLTAANDTEHVTAALNYGIIDYLIKPFSFNRFKQAVDHFLTLNKILIKKQKISQTELDHLLHADTYPNTQELPKGLSPFSLNKVKQAIQNCTSPFSNQDIAMISKLSRISTKKYLDFLEKTGWVTAKIHYQKIGRPVKIYQLTQKK